MTRDSDALHSPTKPEDCFVCRKHRGEVEVPGGVVYEDDLVYVSHQAMDNGRPTAYPGVFFVEPMRHAPGMADLTDAEAERIGLLTSRLARALQATEEVERTYTAVLGHHVDHLHVWVFPRYRGTPSNVWGMGVFEWQDAPMASRDAIDSLCRQVRDYLARERQDS